MKSVRRSTFLIILTLSNLLGCGAPDPIVPVPPSVEMDRAVQRGSQIVGGFGACGFCHSIDGHATSPLSGGRLISDAYGALQGPNITGAQSGIGTWTDVDFRKAFRGNIRPDGSEISSEVHRGFEWLADADITAITAYVRSLPPVEHTIPPRRLSFLQRNTTGLFDSRMEVKGYVPAIGSQFKLEYGQYVADHVARCASCHTKPGGVIASEEYLAGGREVSFDGEYKIAPNITMSTKSGIGAWAESDVAEYLRTGKTPAGREVDGRFCPVPFYAKAPAEQIAAVVAYLRTVPAVE